MRDLRAISGPVWGMVLEGHSGTVSGSFLDPIWTLSQKPHHLTRFYLHLAVGRALRLDLAQLWVPGGYWVGTGIAPPGPSHPHYPGYTPPAPRTASVVQGARSPR